MINSVLTRIIVVFSFLCCVISGLQAGYQPEFSTAGFFSLPNTGRQAYSMNVALMPLKNLLMIVAGL